MEHDGWQHSGTNMVEFHTQWHSGSDVVKFYTQWTVQWELGVHGPDYSHSGGIHVSCFFMKHCKIIFLIANIFSNEKVPNQTLVLNIAIWK